MELSALSNKKSNLHKRQEKKQHIDKKNKRKKSNFQESKHDIIIEKNIENNTKEHFPNTLNLDNIINNNIINSNSNTIENTNFIQDNTCIEIIKPNKIFHLISQNTINIENELQYSIVASRFNLNQQYRLYYAIILSISEELSDCIFCVALNANTAFIEINTLLKKHKIYKFEMKSINKNISAVIDLTRSKMYFPEFVRKENYENKITNQRYFLYKNLGCDYNFNFGKMLLVICQNEENANRMLQCVMYPQLKLHKNYFITEINITNCKVLLGSLM